MSKKTLFRKQFLRLIRRLLDYDATLSIWRFIRERQENNWLTRNYHGIEWFDGNVNPKYFTIQLRDIIRRACYIYSREERIGKEKTLSE